jgi:GTP-binding protein
VIEVPSEKLGSVMEIVGARRGELEEMHVRGNFTHARFMIPARGLIGIRTRLLNSTQGTAVIHHRYAGYKPMQGEVPHRPNGVYISMVSRDNDLAVNPTKEKKLTNIRAAGSDENILLKPPRKMDLEAALEYIEDDELVEVTPTQIRLRKMLLTENDRRRQTRKHQDQLAAAK